MTEQILGEYADYVDGLEIIPSDKSKFEVSINGELSFSKLATKRHPEMKEIREILKNKAFG